jgi:predicted pyridoxine 5'-phosphate oxidase superfamily flavin-nucleotide-binding protein
MAYGFLDIAATASVKEAQRENGSADYWAGFHGERSFDRFTENEAAFIAARDSFFMATVSESGWPYVQHRGGPPGFIRMLDDKTLAIADFRGNRQYITVGNVAAGGRASLILVDYANRRRLKIFAHVEVKNLADNPELAAAVATPGYKAKPERVLKFHLDAFDWNCPQHITQRVTEAEIDAALAPVRRAPRATRSGEQDAAGKTRCARRCLLLIRPRDSGGGGPPGEAGWWRGRLTCRFVILEERARMPEQI